MRLKRPVKKGYAIRTFIAIKLPDACIRELARIQEELDRGWRGISWVRPESIHLTLKFLGEVDPQKIDEIGAKLLEASKDVKPITIGVEGVGGFPNLKGPRVVWVGLNENAALTQLQENIEEKLAEIGFEPEERSFKPHLTLCRVKDPRDGRELGKLVESVRPNIKMDFRADSFVLFESVLFPKGAKYTPLKVMRLE